MRRCCCYESKIWIFTDNMRDDLLWVWDQRNVICIYTHMHARRKYEKESGEANEKTKQNRIELNRIVLCKRRVRTQTHKPMNEATNGTYKHPTGKHLPSHCLLFTFMHTLAHAAAAAAQTTKHEHTAQHSVNAERIRTCGENVERLEKHNVSIGFLLLTGKCIAFCQFSCAAVVRPYVRCVHFSSTFDNFLFNFDDHLILSQNFVFCVH